VVYAAFELRIVTPVPLIRAHFSSEMDVTHILASIRVTLQDAHY